MEKRKTVDTRQFEMKQIRQTDHIPLFAGRPKRKTIISKDDVTNLTIALGTSSSIDELIAKT